MEEIWKDVPGFEDSHQVSNLGRIRAKDRYIKCKHGSVSLKKGKILKPVVCKNGYLEAQFTVNNVRKVFLLHRLVAMVFIDNPNNYPEVNHLDEDITNNKINNLEWCSSKYNANYGTRNERCWMNNPQKKKVNKYSIDGTFIAEYPSISTAAKEHGITDSPIVRVCKGKQNTSCGYVWKYA